MGRKLDSATIADLGRARKVSSDKDNTTVIEGRGDDELIKSRMTQIKSQIDTTTSDFDREKLQERLAKLAGGVAVIKVGAATEVELKEKKARVEDALSATRAAVEEGIVAGGGTTLIRIQKGLDKVKGAEPDETTGVQIVRRALEEPVRQIAANSGAEGSVIIQGIRESKAKNYGYDAEIEKWGDMIEMGIVDPAKVARAAVENAASIASMILTTEAMITEKPDKTPAMPPMPPDGGMGGHGRLLAVCRLTEDKGGAARTDGPSFSLSVSPPGPPSFSRRRPLRNSGPGHVGAQGGRFANRPYGMRRYAARVTQKPP